MTATTIKISTELRDRINSAAAERGITAGSMVEQAFEDFLWREKIESAIRAMRAMNESERADYMADVAEWDATLADGLAER